MAAGAVALVLATAAPASAASQSCVAPPGTSGIDQYCEALRGRGHNQGRGDKGAGPNAVSGRPVPKNAQRQLGKAGSDGAALLNLTHSSPAEKGTTGNGVSPSKPAQ